VRVSEAVPPGDPDYLPPDEYGFDELYCDERNCDCRRVMINVLARHTGRHVATINHAFEPPPKDELVPEQTFLDPLNRQSQWAPALLDLFVNVVLADENYRQRLIRHYHMFKNVVDDPPTRLTDFSASRNQAGRLSERSRLLRAAANANGGAEDRLIPLAVRSASPAVSFCRLSRRGKASSPPRISCRCGNDPGGTSPPRCAPA
jgi:hypothetical protein